MMVLRNENQSRYHLCAFRDIHQDHSTIATMKRAFKTRTIYGYELIWNNIDFQTNALLFLRKDILKKISTLSAYVPRKGVIMDPDFIRSSLAL